MRRSEYTVPPQNWKISIDKLGSNGQQLATDLYAALTHKVVYLVHLNSEIYQSAKSDVNLIGDFSILDLVVQLAGGYELPSSTIMPENAIQILGDYVQDKFCCSFCVKLWCIYNTFFVDVDVFVYFL